MQTTGKLVAGRELDALVAEVMGAVLSLEQRKEQGVGKSDPTVYFGIDGLVRTYPAPYSTSIAAAWQVVQHFQERGWQVHIDWDGPRFNAWVVEIWLGPDGREDMGANAETAPLAICRAALAATRRG